MCGLLLYNSTLNVYFINNLGQIHWKDVSCFHSFPSTKLRVFVGTSLLPTLFIYYISLLNAPSCKTHDF